MLTEIADDARPVPGPRVVATKLDDELVLCDKLSGEVYVLNHTGARIWALCDGDRRMREIAQMISAEFGVTYQRARADVLWLVRDLQAEHLLILE